jgi:hypothetical protein
MENCLVSTLKGTVNGNLPILGKVRILVTTGVRFRISGNLTVESLDGKTFNVNTGSSVYSNVTTMNLTSTGNTYNITVNDGTTLLAFTKSTLAQIQSTATGGSYSLSVYAEDLEYVNLNNLVLQGDGTHVLGNISRIHSLVPMDLVLLSVNRLSETPLNISDLVDNNFTQYRVLNSVGTVSEANAKFANVTKFNISYSDKFTGNIEGLYLPNLTEFGFVNVPNITGDLKNWAIGMQAAITQEKPTIKVSIIFTSPHGTTTTIKWDGQNIATAAGTNSPVVTITASSVSIGAS